jgi:putative sigma-54 modulation protein
LRLPAFGHGWLADQGAASLRQCDGDNLVQIKISTRHGQLSEASQDKIRAKADKLSRIFERLTAIEVIVDLTDEATPRVDLKVAAEHKHDFVAHDQSDNLMGSVDTVVHRLEQQLRKYKEKVQERHRNSDPRRRETQPAPETEMDGE